MHKSQLQHKKKVHFLPQTKAEVLYTEACRGCSKSKKSASLNSTHAQCCYIHTLWHKHSDAKLSEFQKLIKRPKEVLDGWLKLCRGWEQDRTEQTEWTSPSLLRVWNGTIDAFSYPGTLNTHEQFRAVKGKSWEGGTWRWSKNSATVPSAGEAPPAFTTTVKSPGTESIPKNQCSRQRAHPDTHSQP